MPPVDTDTTVKPYKRPNRTVGFQPTKKNLARLKAACRRGRHGTLSAVINAALDAYKW